MNEEKWGLGGIVVLLLIVWVFFGNGFGRFGNNGCGGWGDGCVNGVNNFGFQNFKATCDAEKREIINTATTQYLTEQQSAQTRELINATANATQTKIDFYAYQDMRDKLGETQRALMEANNKLFVKDQLAPITAQLTSIQCQMLRRPDVTGIGAVCPNAAIINGLGVNSLNGCGCGSCGSCNCGGFV